MEISSNSFGLFTEFSFWVDEILVILKRPPLVDGIYETPKDSDVSIIVDPDNEWESPLTEKQKDDIVLFVRNEISEGKLKLPCSLEYNTFDFTKEEYFYIS
jgi:hypothetical protein